MKTFFQLSTDQAIVLVSEPPSIATTRNRPSGEKATERHGWDNVQPATLRREAVSRTISFLSEPHDARYRPSGETDTSVTQSVWSRRMARV